MTRLKALVSNPVERSPADESLPFLALEHIESGVGRLLPGTEIEPKIDDTAVTHRVGDVRFGKLRPYLAKSLYMTESGHGSGELLVLRPRPGEIDGRFLHYLTLSKAFVEWATATSFGVKMPRTSWEAIGRFSIDQPTVDEQRRIADHLDAETARIDTLIAEQRGLLALGKERLAAGREAAFGRGRLRRLKEVLTEWPTYGVLVPEFVDEGVPFIRVGDISSLQSDTVPDRRIPTRLALQYRRTILAGGETLVSVVGSLTHASVVPERLAGANVARAVAVLRTNPERCPAGLLAHFVSTRQYQDQARLATGSDTAQPTLNMGDLANFLIRLPDEPTEIRATTAELEEAAARVESVEMELSRQIALLEEHRQALITHAVTHGIDG